MTDELREVAVLFARDDSPYRRLPGCMVWDRERDARRWQGGTPCIAHPPCGQWGRLRKFAAADAEEKALAPWAAAMVRRWGGVLEHPSKSALWAEAGLPLPGRRDAWGGWCMSVPQFWWGHRADKLTWLYVAGCAPGDAPPVPFQLGEATHTIRSTKHAHFRPPISRSERERTPSALAEWLVALARRCREPEARA